MRIGDGTVIAPEQADKIRDVMADAVRACPPDLAQALLDDMATGSWSPPPQVAPRAPRGPVSVAFRPKARTR